MVEARVLGEPVTYRLGTPGRHIALNSLAVLAAVRGARRRPRARRARPRRSQAAGRARRAHGARPRPGAEALLIDESYNANPASMRAAIATLGAVELPRGGRRIAVLGDMLELGPEAARCTAGSPSAVEANGIDLVFAGRRR